MGRRKDKLRKKWLNIRDGIFPRSTKQGQEDEKVFKEALKNRPIIKKLDDWLDDDLMFEMHFKIRILFNDMMNGMSLTGYRAKIFRRAERLNRKIHYEDSDSAWKMKEKHHNVLKIACALGVRVKDTERLRSPESALSIEDKVCHILKIYKDRQHIPRRFYSFIYNYFKDDIHEIESPRFSAGSLVKVENTLTEQAKFEYGLIIGKPEASWEGIVYPVLIGDQHKLLSRKKISRF